MILNMIGGKELNFAVMGSMEEPASARENLLWVQTGEQVSGWRFDSTEPQEPMEGMLWFPMVTDGGLSFNAVYTNTIHLRINGCRQYRSGLWEEKPVRLRQNGQWQELAV